MILDCSYFHDHHFLVQKKNYFWAHLPTVLPTNVSVARETERSETEKKTRLSLSTLQIRLQWQLWHDEKSLHHFWSTRGKGWCS